MQLRHEIEKRRPAEMSKLLSLKSVFFRSGGRTLLNNIDLDIFRQEIVVFIGPNGAGKSTLARLLLGLLLPTEGSIELPIEIRKAYLPQQLQTAHSIPMTAGDFLNLHPNARHMTYFSEALHLSGLKPSLLSLDWRTLSGGERQRLFLMRALLTRPDLLVLDEPTSFLDLLGRQWFQANLKKIHSALGCTIILISHDLQIGMMQADRVIGLNQRICCQSKSHELSGCNHFKQFCDEQGIDRGWFIYSHSHKANPPFEEGR